MASQSDEAAQLNAIATDIGAIGDGIDQLETALANSGNTTPEVDTALANLKSITDSTLQKLPTTTTSTPPPA